MIWISIGSRHYEDRLRDAMYGMDDDSMIYGIL